MLPEDLRVLITRASEPQEGIAVTWSTTGGSLDPTTSTTGADGLAASTWTLGPTTGAQSATATVADADGSPVTFTATAEEDEPPPPPPPPPPPADATIQVLGPPNNVFSPADVTIQAGQTVEWVWSAEALGHNVSPDDTEPTSSGPVANGPKTYSHTFNTPGTYDYFCVAHGAPGGVGMSGTVTVEP